MKLIYANNPKWINRSQTLIDLTVRFEEINEDLPFTANPNDVETHGRDIYARAVAGEFGNVAPFNVTPPSNDSVKEAVRQERNRRLKNEVDSIVLNPLRWASLTTEQQQTVASHRIALLDITNNPSFPWYNLVVSETDFGYTVDVSKVPWQVLLLPQR